MSATVAASTLRTVIWRRKSGGDEFLSRIHAIGKPHIGDDAAEILVTRDVCEDDGRAVAYQLAEPQPRGTRSFAYSRTPGAQFRCVDAAEADQDFDRVLRPWVCGDQKRISVHHLQKICPHRSFDEMLVARLAGARDCNDDARDDGFFAVDARAE